MTLQRLGIDWCNTDGFTNFGLNNPVPLYGGQLPTNAGSSTNIKIFRSGSLVAPEAAQVGRLQLTYYVQYKGAKGKNSLTL